MTACGTKTRLVFPTPPAELLADCPETAPKGFYRENGEVKPLATNGDIVLAYRDAKGDLKLCNADKASLRQWYADMAKEGSAKAK